MSEWVPIGELFQPSRDKESLVGYRRQLIKGIDESLIAARSFRSRKRHIDFGPANDLEVFCDAARNGISSLNGFLFGETSFDNRTDEPARIEPHNFALSSASQTSSDSWVCSVRDDFTLQQTKADWERGHFSWRMLAYHHEGEGWGHVGFSYSAYDLFAVEVDAEAAKKIIGWQVSDAKALTSRQSKYDWEAAFAYVAARFYHDESFDDVNALGVQARVIELLLDSFERRNVSVPNRETCKKKAAIIVGELRSK